MGAGGGRRDNLPSITLLCSGQNCSQYSCLTQLYGASYVYWTYGNINRLPVSSKAWPRVRRAISGINAGLLRDVATLCYLSLSDGADRSGRRANKLLQPSLTGCSHKYGIKSLDQSAAIHFVWELALQLCSWRRPFADWKGHAAEESWEKQCEWPRLEPSVILLYLTQRGVLGQKEKMRTCETNHCHCWQQHKQNKVESETNM